MLSTRHDAARAHADDESAHALVSISLTDSLPSSLSTTLSSNSLVSPKLPRPASNNSNFTFRRRRSSSISRRRILPFIRHISLWGRWSILFFVTLIVLLRLIIRGDRNAMISSGKSKFNWAITRLRPQKVAIYCGRNTDFDIVNSLITAISIQGIRQRVNPSIYAEYTSELGKLTNGQSDWIKKFAVLYSQPLSLLRTAQHKPDVLIVPPSESPLTSAIDILNKNTKTRAILVIKDPKAFTFSLLDNPSLPSFQDLLKAKRISFLLTEKRQVPYFTERMNNLFKDEISFNIEERIKSYFPLLDIPYRKSSLKKKPVLHYGIFYNDDNSKNSINHINNLINEIGQWIKKDGNSTGYDIIQDPSTGKNVLKGRNHGNGIITFHIFFPPHLSKERKEAIKEKFYIPDSLKRPIYIHDNSNVNVLYGVVAKMHLLLPSHPHRFPAYNINDPDPYDPIVPIAFSTHSRVLLPHSLLSAYSACGEGTDSPVIITYPDDPNATRKGDKAISVIEAVSMVNKRQDPRLKMAIAGSPWFRRNVDWYYKPLLDKIVLENADSIAEILSL